jgi:hypothetical protein
LKAEKMIFKMNLLRRRRRRDLDQEEDLKRV